MKEFLLNYAHFRRLGFTEVESLDFATSRPCVKPILAARARRKARIELERRSQLRLVK